MVGLSQAFAADGTPPNTPPINSVWDYFVFHTLSNTALLLSVFVLSVGLVALIIQFRMLRRVDSRPNDILRISSVTLIITFSLAMTAYLDTDTLKEATPIFGLFSTVVA